MGGVVGARVLVLIGRGIDIFARLERSLRARYCVFLNLQLHVVTPGLFYELVFSYI